MSVLWTSAEIASATGGSEIGAFKATGLSIDTRSINAGDLFVPLIDTRDGHDFIEAAMTAGAAGTLTQKDGFSPAIKVDDTMGALQALGQAGRARGRAKRIAVTGSVGKTSVKDALAVMLASFGETHKSQRSFNKHSCRCIARLTCIIKAVSYASFNSLFICICKDYIGPFPAKL